MQGGLLYSVVGDSEMKQTIAKKDQAVFMVRLHKVLGELNWTQSTLSKKAKVSTVTLSRWASGKHPPSLPAIAKIAASTGCREEWLLYGEGDMWNPQSPATHRQKNENYLVKIVIAVDQYITENNLSISSTKKGKIINYLNRVSALIGFNDKSVAEIMEIVIDE